jgi:hypothetical protein
VYNAHDFVRLSKFRFGTLQYFRKVCKLRFKCLTEIYYTLNDLT